MEMKTVKIKKEKGVNRHKRAGTLTYHLLSLPAVLLSGLIILIPAVQTIYSAFTTWNGISDVKVWVGLQNFRELFQDWVFWRAVLNNLKWTMLFVTVPVMIAMTAAVIMARFHIGSKSFQAVYLIPYLLAPTTNAIIWLNMIFSPNGGLIGFMQKLGWQLTSPLGKMDTALIGVAMVDIWHYWGFLTVIYLAALRQTPGDQIEAAAIEGAGGWQTFYYVYLPNIMPTVRLMFILITIYSFCTYDYIYLMTSGGPAHATEVLSTYAYSMAFSAFKFGKAAAVSLVIGVFGCIAAFFYTWFSRKEALE
ncbi:hypothetical protein C808_04324 [Lachnospiraceae bacterium M18-1]|nr:hypothetical protein C808_04324 [Lachnospiraceae bacterium M18-1]